MIPTLNWIQWYYFQTRKIQFSQNIDNFQQKYYRLIRHVLLLISENLFFSVIARLCAHLVVAAVKVWLEVRPLAGEKECCVENWIYWTFRNLQMVLQNKYCCTDMVFWRFFLFCFFVFCYFNHFISGF